MDWEFGLYILSSLIGVMVMLLSARYAWRYRHLPGVAALTWYLVCGAIGPTALTFGQWPHMPVLLTNLCFFIANVVSYLMPGGWFVFTLQYTGRKRWLTKALWIFLIGVPMPELLYLVFRLRLVLTGQITSLYPGLFENIPIQELYSTGLLFGGIAMIAQEMIRAPKRYRGQYYSLLAGVVPWLVGLTQLWQWEIFPDQVLPLAVAAGGAVMAWGLSRYQVFVTMPVALDAVVKSMEDGVVVLDTQGRISEVNPAAQRMLGVGVEVVDLSIETVLPDWPALLAVPGQSEVVRPIEGGVRYYDVRISLLTDEQREAPAGRLILLRDITARREAEEALRRYTAELEASNAELDAFAHTVAHDLKTPLTSLIGFSALLERRYRRMEVEKVEENLHLISQTGHKMTTIINELLLLASVRRMEEIETGPVAMSAVVVEALQRFGERISETGATIVMPERWPAAVGYGPWIEEVWVNYISNAFKYGGTPPRVELGAVVDGDGRVRFWVRDNGAGLTPEQCARLFTQFTRLHQSRVEGHGLGLSIVQRIVERLGGQVGVESTVGEGSTFWFTLPEDRKGSNRTVSDPA